MARELGVNEMIGADGKLWPLIESAGQLREIAKQHKGPRDSGPVRYIAADGTAAFEAGKAYERDRCAAWLEHVAKNSLTPRGVADWFRSAAQSLRQAPLVPPPRAPTEPP